MKTIFDTERIFLNINKAGKGFFALRRGTLTIGKMLFNLSPSAITLIDTEAINKYYLEPITKRLLQELIAFANMRELKIVTSSDILQSQLTSEFQYQVA